MAGRGEQRRAAKSRSFQVLSSFHANSLLKIYFKDHPNIQSQLFSLNILLWKISRIQKVERVMLRTPLYASTISILHLSFALLVSSYLSISAYLYSSTRPILFFGALQSELQTLALYTSKLLCFLLFTLYKTRIIANNYKVLTLSGTVPSTFNALHNMTCMVSLWVECNYHPHFTVEKNWSTENNDCS